MAGTAGHKARLSFSSAPVAIVGEPTTKRPGTAEPDSEFRITDSTRRVLDPATTVDVEVDALANGTWVAAAATDFRVVALDGTIIFYTGLAATALVRVTGAYLPLQLALESFDASATVSTNLLEDTSHGGDGARSRVPGLLDFTAEMSSYAPLLKRYTSGDAGTALAARLLSGEALVLEHMPCGVTTPPLVYRAWVHLESGNESSAVDDLLQGTTNYSATQRPLTGRVGEFASFTLVSW